MILKITKFGEVGQTDFEIFSKKLQVRVGGGGGGMMPLSTSGSLLHSMAVVIAIK